VREATGLVKQLSWVDVFVWSIIFFPWLTSWSGLFWVTPDYYQNVNYYLSLGVWALTALVVVVLYWQLTTAMPRSGGDYVFVSRAIAGSVGFVASFVFYVALLADPGSTGAFWGFSEAGLQLTFAGQVLNNPGITSLGTFLSPFTTSSPVALFAVSTTALFPLPLSVTLTVNLAVPPVCDEPALADSLNAKSTLVVVNGLPHWFTSGAPSSDPKPVARL